MSLYFSRFEGCQTRQSVSQKKKRADRITNEKTCKNHLQVFLLVNLNRPC